MKLFTGGFRDIQSYTVAENEQEAVKQLGEKLGIPHLPVEVKEIEVENFEIRVIELRDIGEGTKEIISEEITINPHTEKEEKLDTKPKAKPKKK